MTPPFLSLSSADRASWREIGVTKAFLVYLDWEEARCADGILAAVRAGKSKEAEILSGKLEAIQELKGALWRTDSPAMVVEDEFTDPAALRTA